MRKLVGAGVELRVGEFGVAEDGGDCVGLPRNLILEQRLHERIGGVVGARVVPFDEELVAFGFVHEGHRRDRQTRAGSERLEQSFEMAQPSQDRGVVEEVGVVVAIDEQAVGRLDHVHEEIEIDESFGVGADFGADAGDAEIGAEAFEIELHVAERQMAGVAR